MTVRSIILGLLSAILLCSWCYFNDTVIRAGMTVSSLMPIVAYGGLVFFVLAINPLLRRLGQRWALRGAEVGVILVLFLMACGIPGWGLVQLFPETVMLPHHDARITPGWQQEKVLSLAPRQMLTDVHGDESRALDGYVTGLGEGDQYISPTQVPWGAWTRTFLFWGPLVISMLAAVLGLAAVFHRQWSRHEQLPYPIPIFAHALFPERDGRLNPIFRNLLFWVGFLFAFLILMNNYACRFWPQVLIRVPLRLNFTPLVSLLPVLVKGKGMVLFYPQIMFPVVGLAYFLASDVSASMFIAPFAYCMIAGVLAGYGVELRAGKMMALSIEPFIFAGGYFAILVMLLYTGRHYYWSTLRAGFGLRSRDEVPSYAVFGMRLFLLGTGLFLVQLVAVGLDWQLAVLYTMIALMIYIVVSRIIVETGAFDVGTYVYPGVTIWGLFGAAALGPRILLVMFLVSTVLLAAPGWCVMPFAAQAFKLAEMSEVPLRRTVRWGAVTLLVSLLVAVPVTIYWQYDRGAPTVGWPRASSRYPFANAVTITHTLKAQGLLKTAGKATGWARIAHMSPHLPQCAAFGITFVLALIVSLGRLRFARWPVHPVIFLFLGGLQGMVMSFSFGIGWLIKTAVTKYGGGHTYQKLKPGMIGLIAGSMLGGFLPMVIGTVYYLVAGHTP